VLPTIHMFWHGAPLSRLERLCLTSFVANGHPVDLYVYEELADVPSGVHLADARAVLPREALFLHRRTGSVGLFSDWFRYRLLLERGGIWADTDVVCLEPLRYPSELIFAWQEERLLNNAVLGLPAGHEVAAWLVDCCENPNRIRPYDSLSIRARKWRRRYLQGDRRDRVRWGEYGPKGLTLTVRHLGYEHYALPTEHFYPVRCNDWHWIFQSAAETPSIMLEGSRAVHLWNNMMRERPGFDKRGRFPDDSLFEKLCRRYL
jgi:hypothetical protein